MTSQTCLVCGSTRDLDREQRHDDLVAELRRHIAALERRLAREAAL